MFLRCCRYCTSLGPLHLAGPLPGGSSSGYLPSSMAPLPADFANVTFSKRYNLTSCRASQLCPPNFSFSALLHLSIVFITLEHILICYLSFLLFITHLPPAAYKLQEGRDLYLFCSWSHPKLLAYSKHSINICQMD